MLKMADLPIRMHYPNGRVKDSGEVGALSPRNKWALRTVVLR